jgi:hypothetical protein
MSIAEPAASAPVDVRNPAERRRENRLPCRKSISIIPCAGQPVTALLLDCSAHGLGLSMPQPMRVGDEFMLNVNMPSPAVLLYTVRNCRASGSGYRVGAEFLGFIVAPAQSTRETIVDALMKP